ncbi:hypothetical protein G4B88_017292 [Cannabis sativa]|uniref:Pentatricopeptide repeat-containing protein n=1 Tax=Cannabis sativa TaxID=3483 RepID=A0A7J6HSG3_CANSA|nr:hypothetical protein G4B88_017292 [Cannabis sativa]
MNSFVFLNLAPTNKLGSIEDSCKVFRNMKGHNQVSWNAMISGFTSKNHHLEAFEFFLKMKNEGISPNMYTIISVSNVVGKIGDTDKGKIVQAYAFELHLDSNINVGTALIDMYSKCKSLSYARSIFDSNFTSCGIHTPMECNDIRLFTMWVQPIKLWNYL